MIYNMSTEETKEERLIREREERRKEQAKKDQARLRQINARKKQQERKKRNHVLIVIGALVVNHTRREDMRPLIQKFCSKSEKEKIKEIYPDMVTAPKS